MIENILIISPHIDDAVLSIGGILLKQKNQKAAIKISYIFTVSDWTNKESIAPCTIEKNTDQVTNERKMEEKAAGQALGYEYAFGDFLDLPIRDQSKAGFLKLKNDLYCHLVNKFKPDDIILFPVGISHPDHQAVGEVGRILSAENFNIIFYEDLPYFARYNDISRSQIYNQLKKRELISKTIQIDIEKKIDAVRLYKTQVSLDWINDIANYSYCLSDNTYHERLWIPKKIYREIGSLL